MSKLQITIFADDNEIDFSMLDKVFRTTAATKAEVKTGSGVQTTKPKTEPTLNEKLKAKEEAAEKAAIKAEEPAVKEEPKSLDSTYDNVKVSVLELSKKKGRDAAKAALAKFGYEKVSAEMKSDDYGNVIAECQAQIAA